MLVEFTDTQKQRLVELDAEKGYLALTFFETTSRDAYFETLHKTLVDTNRARVRELNELGYVPPSRKIESQLRQSLTDLSFAEVRTPIIISKGSLIKMGLSEEHPLCAQVFWLNSRQCLRPMLAPNLYYMLSHLQRLLPRPIRIFEVGPCFRKESKGSSHLSEFTMLNLVELGPQSRVEMRLEEIISQLFSSNGIKYKLEKKPSDVYGTTVDVVLSDIEVGSGAYGPHRLDRNWGIDEAWVGLGLGIERLAMMIGKYSNIGRVGPSLMYVNGARLNI